MREAATGTELVGLAGVLLFGGTLNPTDSDPPLPSKPLGTILIVDNDPVLRMLLNKYLTLVGYRVLEGRTGRGALKLLERYPEPIDLLLTDVMMHGMSGFELADAFVDVHPRAKVLYMSGHVYDVGAVGDAFQRDPDAFMVKPFWAEQLLQKLQGILPTPDASDQEP